MDWNIVGFILAICLGIGRPAPTTDMVELNHYIDGEDKHHYSQLIFWQYSPEYRRFHAHGWVLVDSDSSLFVDRYSMPGKIVVTWLDRDSKKKRIVSKNFRQTETKYDPERGNHRLFPVEFRVDIFKVKLPQAERE